MQLGSQRRWFDGAPEIIALAIALVATLVNSAQGRSPYLAPQSLASDCSVDVTDQLNSWIESVPDQSVLTFRRVGCYRIEKTVLVRNRHGLTFEGNGATFRAFTDGSGYVDNVQTRNHFYLWGGGDLTVRNLSVQGVNTDHRYRPEFAGQRGFRIAGVQGALLEDISVYEVRGDFVEIDPDYYQSWRWSSDITIRKSRFEHAGRQGITITGGRNVVIAGNTLSDAARSMFDVEPDGGTGRDALGVPTGGGADNVQILDNDIGPAGLVFFGNIVDLKYVVTEDVTISANRLHGIPLNVWVVGQRSAHYRNYTITDNVSDRTYAGPRGGVELVYVDGSLVRGNKAPFYFASSTPGVGVKVWGSSDVTVQDNRFPGARVVLEVDGPRFGSPWTGDPSGTTAACGNSFGEPGNLTVDRACP